MQRLVCIMHSYRLAAIMMKMELVYGYIVVPSSPVAASLNECMRHTKRCIQHRLLMKNSLPIRNM